MAQKDSTGKARKVTVRAPEVRSTSQMGALHEKGDCGSEQQVIRAVETQTDVVGRTLPITSGEGSRIQGVTSKAVHRALMPSK